MSKRTYTIMAVTAMILFPSSVLTALFIPQITLDSVSLAVLSFGLLSGFAFLLVPEPKR